MTDYTRPSTLPVWAESGDTVQPTNPEIETGWPESNIPPSRQRFNWLLNFLANAVRYLLQIGVAEWAAAENYRIGSRVQYSGVTYKALTDNTNKQPDTNASDWERWGYASSEIMGRVDSILSKSVAGDVDVTLTATEAGNGVLIFTGLLTGNINVIVPNSARRWVVQNATTGSFTLSIKTASGAALPIAQGSTKGFSIFCDGANGVYLSGAAADVAISSVSFTATAGQTSFGMTYTPGEVYQVFRNGASVGFTATSGSAVVLSVAASLNDVVIVYKASSFNVANALAKSGDTMTGPLTLSGNASGALHAVPKQQLDAFTPAALNTASGSAPSYAARAWVSFNGTGTVAIRAGGNVSSITDDGAGIYTINFTTAMQDANYCMASSCQNGSSDDTWACIPYARATGSIQVLTSLSNINADASDVNCAIFR